jgi:TatD DNase family protein
MFDTHAHLNFKRFKKDVDDIILQALASDFDGIVIPGTDVVSSRRAIELAEKYEKVYAAVGIHPHHNFPGKDHTDANDAEGVNQKLISEIEEIIKSHQDNGKKIVAIGEIGLDRHVYEETKYEDYHVDEAFIASQKELFVAQLGLAKKYDLSVIVHNREAIQDLLPLLESNWDDYFSGRMVFHCCEPKQELLDFAIAHHIYIGIDGDITYTTDEALQKRKFIPRVPKEMLVLETDSPFLLPEPLRAEKKYPNTPLNIKLVGEYVAQIRNEDPEELFKSTSYNAQSLFKV